jgi:hypothetical protein
MILQLNNPSKNTMKKGHRKMAFLFSIATFVPQKYWIHEDLGLRQ